MEIQLIKYSSLDNSAVLITDTQLYNVSIKDKNGVEFNVNETTSTHTYIGYITEFRTLKSNLTSTSTANPDFSAVSIVKATNIDAESVDCAMYDNTVFAVTKIDMLNAIKDTGDTSFYKHLVKFTFLELAMNDVAKYSGNVEDTLSFYNEMVIITNLFKTKYHYYDKL